MSDHLLTYLIFFPIAAALIALIVPPGRTLFFKSLALITSIAQVIILLLMIPSLKQVTTNSSLILTEQVNWFSITLGSLGTLQAEYFIGLDGLSLPLVALSVFIMLIATISSWTIQSNHKGYFILLLILNGAIIGTFSALDFILFYLFFEFMLFPMYFLIGIWGGPKREYASIKFLLYTIFGSILILIVIIGLYASVKTPDVNDHIVHTFNMMHMQDSSNFISGSILSADGWLIASKSARYWAFILIFIGFAIKLPAVPFHTWLPDAHVEAPTPISVILAALLLKIGGYGLMRIAYPIFPDVAIQLSWAVALVGVISILYGAFNALGSKDLKRLIAYSSVSHMGFVLLGIASVTSEGIAGAIYQMVSHGIISALLFLIAGVLYDRTHNRMIENYSGLGTRMPVYFTVVLIAFFASLGLPGFSGFIAEILILFGAFQSNTVNGLFHESYAVIATLGLLLGAAYYLWTIQRMFFGSFSVKNNIVASQLYDLDKRELTMMLPLAFFAILLGILPHLLLDVVNPFVQSFIDIVIQHSSPSDFHP